MTAEPVPVVLHLSMMDEQTPQGNRARPFAVLRQSNAHRAALVWRARLGYRQPALRCDEFPARAFPETWKSANRLRLLPTVRCVIRRCPTLPRELSAPALLPVQLFRDLTPSARVSRPHQC